ncbi:hypothetical protein [Acidithiobacillus thiooxidans]|jgi:hypothetical protein|uniref:hypothetical protein n=1 Tax=Acidithiobacillus thiooxidans TaxID=930 RepID=UPI0004E12269|nr:hypothetical protein [Acidithiobacillus thiooxidans]
MEQKKVSAKDFFEKMEQMAPEEADQELARLMVGYGIQAKPAQGALYRPAWPEHKPLGIAYG